MLVITRCSYLGSQFTNAVIQDNGDVDRRINEDLYENEALLFTKQSSPSIFEILYTNKQGKLACFVAGIGRSMDGGAFPWQANNDKKMINFILVEENEKDREDIVAFARSFTKDFFGTGNALLELMSCNREDKVSPYIFDTDRLFSLILSCEKVENVGIENSMNKILLYFTPHKKDQCNIDWLCKDYEKIGLSLNKKDMFFEEISDKKFNSIVENASVSAKFKKAFNVVKEKFETGFKGLMNLFKEE